MCHQKALLASISMNTCGILLLILGAFRSDLTFADNIPLITGVWLAVKLQCTRPVCAAKQGLASHGFL